MRDEELRAELASWVREVAELPAPGVDVLRRRSRNRMLRRAAAVCTVIAVIAGIGLGVNAGLQGGADGGPVRPVGPAGPRPAAASQAQWTWYPDASFPAGKLPAADAGPSVAPYVMQIDVGAPGSVNVLSASTGLQAIILDPPSGVYYVGVAAAGDDHTFVLAAVAGPAMRFYEIRLGPGGKPQAMALVLSVPVKSMPDSFDFAVSPDSSMLAYTAHTGIEVVALRTGKATSWPTGSAFTDDLSWAGDDRTLAFGLYPASAHAQGQFGIRLLDTRHTGSLMQASRLAIPASRLSDVDATPLITPDGSKILASIFYGVSAQGVPGSAAVQEFSALTGRLLTAVTPKVKAGNQVNSGLLLCQPLWTNASGSQVASYCDPADTYDAGIIVYDDGHFVSNTMQVPLSDEVPAGSSGPSQEGPQLAW
jgi:hypothetical protein